MRRQTARPPTETGVQQDKDPPCEHFWLSALFWVLGTLYVVTIVANFWFAIEPVFR